MVHARFLAPLVRTRGFGMTPLNVEFKLSHYRLLGDFGLRNRIGAIEEERGDFLEDCGPDIYGAVDPVRRLKPVHLAGTCVPGLGGGAVTKLNLKAVSTYNNAYTVKRIAMPWRGFSGTEAQAPDQTVTAAMKDFLVAPRWIVHGYPPADPSRYLRNQLSYCPQSLSKICFFSLGGSLRARNPLLWYSGYSAATNASR